jgi:hypothetical protein
MEKRIYNSPELHKIYLDNAISLVLESDPPTYESGNTNTSPEYFNNNIFRTNIA